MLLYNIIGALHKIFGPPLRDKNIMRKIMPISKKQELALLLVFKGNKLIAKQLVFNECAYYVHPIFNLYAASRDGQIIHIIKLLPSNSHKQGTGYLQCTVRKYGDKNQKTYRVRYLGMF